EGIAIGLGTMIGAGIFVLSALAAERAGPASMISYVLAGAICLPIALVISELATGMPRAGGSYTFIAQALGPLAGSIVGPGNWLGLTFATGFYLLAFGEYLSLIVPVPPWTGSLLAGILFTWLNYRGAKITGSVQNLVVVILMVILILFIGVGLFNVDAELHRPFAPQGWGAVVGTIGLIIVSFTGFEKISTIAEEMKRPGRNLPLAIVGSVIAATIIYALILFVITGIFPYTEVGQREAPLVEAAGSMVGPVGTVTMLTAALLATLSSANAAVMASSRISYGMGRDRVLPKWFSHIHPKHSTPSHAILVTGGLGVLLSLTGRAETLAEISSALFMVSYALLCLSVMVMRGSRPRWYRPTFRVPLYPVLPVVAGLLCLAVILTMSPESRTAGLGLVGASLVWYFAWVRRQATVTGEIGPLWERERPLEGVIEAAESATRADRHEVLIPLLPATRTEPLLGLAAALAQADDRRVIIALEVTVVPPQTPLEFAEARLAQKSTTQEESPLAQVARQGATVGVPVRPMRRAAHAVASGVLAVAEARPTVELILLNWQGPLSAGRIYGSPSKTMLQEAHCDVAVLRERHLKEVHRVLVPAGGGPHARLGLRLAADIAHSGEAELTIVRVVRPAEDLDVEAEMRGLRHLAEEVLGGPDPRLRTRILVHDAVVEGILEEAQNGGYDLLVIGASNEWAVKSLLVGALPDALADRAPCSVLMVRRYEPTGISTIRRVVRSIKGW
ncbi:MAG: amino acid permease, partial [Chloroflexi bacterium]|nr:amino acid permease [Chloroflexota bacterium]